MSIRDKDKFFENLWDWKIFNGCFGDTKISPTDVDGFVERKGNFLLIETKLPGNEVTIGQQITYDNLIKLPKFYVLIIWGQKDNPEEAQFWGMKKMPVDLERLRELIKRWFCNADGIEYKYIKKEKPELRTDEEYQEIRDSEQYPDLTISDMKFIDSQ